jgi:dTDP-4-dehydrorhamnose reductase
MNILVVGAGGYLGSYLSRKLPCDSWKRHDPWPQKSYDYVINCVGLSDLEYCEKHQVESYSSNFAFVLELCRRYSEAKFIHFSSYYVYDSDLPNHEGSFTTRQYAYCRDKLDSEKLIIEREEYGVVFRLGKLFGNPFASQRKLTEHLIDCGVRGDRVTVDDQLFNPTSVHQAYEAVIAELWNGNTVGRRNLACENVASHYSYAREIRQFLPKLRIKRVDKLPRMFHNYGRFLMDLSMIRSEIVLRPWQDDLRDYLFETGVVNA